MRAGVNGAAGRGFKYAGPRWKHEDAFRYNPIADEERERERERERGGLERVIIKLPPTHTPFVV